MDSIMEKKYYKNYKYYYLFRSFLFLYKHQIRLEISFCIKKNFQATNGMKNFSKLYFFPV